MPQHMQPLTVQFSFVTDDMDDWGYEVVSKPSEVQNDMYAQDEEDDDDIGEDFEGRKVMVRGHNVTIL